jgi:hypothetical protein
MYYKDFKRTMNIRTVIDFSRASRPYHDDAPMRDDLAGLSCADFHSFIYEKDTPRSLRSKVRYLAALMPDLNLFDLADSIHAAICNEDLSPSDVRLILEGRSLVDASRRTSEVPIEAIQEAGRMLSDGSERAAVARTVGLSVDTVTAIDVYLGLGARHDERLRDAATAAVREGWSVRQLAKAAGMSRSQAHRYMVQARRVLVELGELS